MERLNQEGWGQCQSNTIGLILDTPIDFAFSPCVKSLQIRIEFIIMCSLSLHTAACISKIIGFYKKLVINCFAIQSWAILID